MSKKTNMNATTMKRILKMITIIEDAERQGWQSVHGGYMISHSIDDKGNHIVRLWGNEEKLIDKEVVLLFNLEYIYITHAAQQIVEFIY